MRRLALPVLAALTALAAGCGQTPSTEPAVGDRPSSNGLRTYEVPSAGFSVAVPESWTSASAGEVLSDEAAARWSEEAPDLAPALASLGSQSSLVKLIAYDAADAGTNFATNLNVVVEPLPGRVGRDRYFTLTLAQLMRLFGPDVQIVEHRLKLPAGWAMRLSYQGFTAPAGRLATTQYVFFRRGAGYVLTYTTPTARLAEDEADFERSARTFAVLPG